MNHPAPEIMLRYADGDDVEATVVQHLRECDECGATLRELGRFEASVASAVPIAPGHRQAMREVAERLLDRHQPRVSRWRLAGLAVALAAGALAFVALWQSGRPACTVGVHRYTPADTMRGQPAERFHLDVEVTAPRWLGLWRLDAEGRRQRLLPNVDPLLRYLGTEMPLPPGQHRLPATDVLDFEFAKDAAPSALLLVPTAVELQPDEIDAIEALLATKPPEQLLAAVAAVHGEARLIPFPAR